MKLSYLKLGVNSLEHAVRHLQVPKDGDLIVSVMLGHHAITCFMKDAAERNGQTVTRCASFSQVQGWLNKLGLFEGGETKLLNELNGIRNSIEHDEPDFSPKQFQKSLLNCVHIIERIGGEDVDLQLLVSNETWTFLIDIDAFTDERSSRLKLLMDKEWGPVNCPKDRLAIAAQEMFCDVCGQRALLWSGATGDKVRCKFCSEVTTYTTCVVCGQLIEFDAGTVAGFDVHQACFDRWGESK